MNYNEFKNGYKYMVKMVKNIFLFHYIQPIKLQNTLTSISKLRTLRTAALLNSKRMASMKTDESLF